MRSEQEIKEQISSYKNSLEMQQSLFRVSETEFDSRSALLGETIYESRIEALEWVLDQQKEVLNEFR